LNQSERINYLAARVLKQEADQAELEELSAFLSNGSDESVQHLEQLIAAHIPAEHLPLGEITIKEMSARILRMDHAVESTMVEMNSPIPNAALVEQSTVVEMHRISFLRKWWWAAASVVILLSIGAYLFMGNNKPPTVAATTQPIAPGKSGAILTLDNGVEVILDSVANGVVAIQHGAEAMIENGQLKYRSSGSNSTVVAYNTMSTPKGREYRLTLPDGTQVWLNAASSIRYPTVFTGNERKVEITGEAYFEVAKNATKPFYVLANKKATIQVLGTHFNVNAYDNETSLSTTLLEGAVKVNGTLIKPGQQVQIDKEGASNVRNDIDTDKVMAWKNGYFNFEGAGIEEIMRQIARWYDIEVIFEGAKPKVEFEGKMTRDVSLDGLIVLLKKAGIHLRLEDRKLIVLP
jgi:ribosomal 50S subunit-recycling heat shock protein